MNTRPISAFLAVPLLLPGCVVYSRDTVYTEPDETVVVVTEPPPVVVYNAAPWVDGGEAYVWFDPAAHADIVSLTAVVDDLDGIGDVLGVWADVYDDWAGGQLVASVELVPTTDPYVYVADVYAADLWVDPLWGGYSVDLVVYDWYEDFGWMTVPLQTYAY